MYEYIHIQEQPALKPRKLILNLLILAVISEFD